MVELCKTQVIAGQIAQPGECVAWRHPACGDVRQQLGDGAIVWRVHRGQCNRARPRSTELDALGQRQLVGVVDGAGLAPHVSLPGVAAGLSSTTGVLFTTECAADFGTARSDVHVGDAAVAALAAQKAFTREDRGGEDSARQPLGHTVLHGNGLFEIVHLDQVDQWGKGLLLQQGEVGIHRRDGGLDEETLFAAFDGCGLAAAEDRAGMQVELENISVCVF